MHTPVTEWKNNASYQKGRQVIASLRVVNDHARHVVKLMSDMNRSLTKDEQSFQNLLLLRIFQHNGLKLDEDLIFSGLVQNVYVYRMAESKKI